MLKQQKIFFDFLRFCIGSAKEIPGSLKEVDWKELYAIAKKQCLVGVLFDGIKKLNPGKVTVLHADDIQAENKIDNKNVVVPVVSDAQVQGNVLNVKMKPNSFVVYRF